MVDCHICHKPLSIEFEIIAIFLEMLEEQRIRTATCSIDSENLNITFLLSVNLRGYDMHLIASAGKFKSEPISCIPNNMEKYISFSLGDLRFTNEL